MTKEQFPERIYLDRVSDGRINGLWHDSGEVEYVRADLVRSAVEPEPPRTPQDVVDSMTAEEQQALWASLSRQFTGETP